MDVWDLLGEPLSAEQVVSRLEERYSDVPAAEVNALLRTLLASGLVERLDIDERG